MFLEIITEILVYSFLLVKGFELAFKKYLDGNNTVSRYIK